MILIGRGLDFRYDLEPIGNTNKQVNISWIISCAVVKVRK